MSVKITRNLRFLKMLDEAREEFKEELERSVPPEIIKTIEGGNNPIKAGKPVKYSDSYLKAIEGPKKSKESTTGASSKLSFGENGKSKKTKKVSTGGLARKYGKKKSPVNLILTREMINSMKTYQTIKGLMVYFTDKKAEWHNDGVPENNLPARRLLPTNPGEDFNRNIKNRIIEALKKAVKKSI